jgi:antitoxin (DNA-binding transcriptional repressor) of toxin-antitoxin stability system
MAAVSAFVAKTRFGELLDRVAAGEEIVITRHDRPVARIVREGAPMLADVGRAVEGLRALQRRIAVRGPGRAKLSDRDVRSAIDEGRL